MKFRKFWKKSKDTFEEISPITIDPSTTSLTVGISRRFLLFKLFEKLQRKVEDNPQLNFLSNLRSYKLLGEVLTGTLHEFYRDRNNLYFKNFFVDEKLYEIVKDDLTWVHKHAKKRKDDMKITITKRGVVIYDNYRPDQFNVLLMTIHSGTWMRSDIQKKQAISKEDRLLEEDISTQRIYGPIVLQKGGIWIDNKTSRFECDYNRDRNKAIYWDKSEEWLKKLWKQPLTKSEKEWLLEGYDEFYHTLASLIRSYHFNIIFDGHSMKDGPDRPEFSFGTQYIPKFYMPIVQAMLEKLYSIGYDDVAFDKPFSGGHILQWMKQKFPDRFIFTIEVNKKLYMTKDRTRVLEQNLEKVSKDVASIFDLETFV